MFFSRWANGLPNVQCTQLYITENITSIVSRPIKWNPHCCLQVRNIFFVWGIHWHRMVQPIVVQSPVISSRITGVSIVYSAVHWVTDHRKHQSSRSLAVVRGIHRWPMDSPHKGPVTRKLFHLMTSSWYGSLTNIQVWDGIGIYTIRMRQLVVPMKWHL